MKKVINVFLSAVMAISMLSACSKKEKQPIIVGTWYSNRPDTIVFLEDGTYTGDGKWLNSGTYTVDGNTITTTGTLDGECTLTIIEENGTIILQNSSYIYYTTKEAADERIAQDETERADSEANIVPNTQMALLGEWTSKDEMATLTVSETTIILHYLGSQYVEEAYIEYTYTIVDGSKIEITSMDNNLTFVNDYTFTIKDDGTQEFWCNGFTYGVYLFQRSVESDE